MKKTPLNKVHYDRKASKPIEVVVLVREQGFDNYGRICSKNEAAVGETLRREPKGKGTES